MNTALRGLLALLLAAAAAAQSPPADQPAEPPPEQPAPVPEAPAPEPQGRPLLPAGSDGPAAAPHAAVGADGTVLAAFAAEDEIRAALSRDGGQSFGPPERVGEAGQLAAGPSRGPRAAVTPESLVVLAICGEAADGSDGNLLAWRSDDRGARWKGPARVNAVAGSAREGLHAVAAAPDGALFAVWPDERGHGMELRGAWSHDGGETWEELLLYTSPDGSICECCAPAASFDPLTGQGLALWRNNLGGMRDMHLLALGRAEVPNNESQLLGTGHWELSGCPMAGGGIAVAAGGERLSFWRRGSELFTAVPGLGEARVGEGRETSLAAGPDGFHLAWTDTAGRVHTARALHLGGAQDSRPLGRGLNVSVAGAPDGLGPVLVTWETGEGTASSLRSEVLATRQRD
jgi:hypothetical protein